MGQTLQLTTDAENGQIVVSSRRTLLLTLGPSQKGTTMRYRASIPEGIKPGQIVPVKVSGVVVSVRLPKGKVGDAFIFEVTKETWEAARNNPSPVEGPPLQADLVRRRRSILRRLSSMCSCSCMYCDKDKFGHISDFAVAV